MTVSFEQLSRRLLGVIEDELKTVKCSQSNVSTAEINFQSFEYSSAVTSLTQVEHFLTTRCEVKNFNVHVHADWFVAFHTDVHLQLNRYANKKTVLAYLKGKDGWSKRPDAYREWQSIPADAVVLPDDDQVKRYVKEICDQGLKSLEDGQQVGRAGSRRAQQSNAIIKSL